MVGFRSSWWVSTLLQKSDSVWISPQYKATCFPRGRSRHWGHRVLFLLYSLHLVIAPKKSNSSKHHSACPSECLLLRVSSVHPNLSLAYLSVPQRQGIWIPPTAPVPSKLWFLFYWVKGWHLLQLFLCQRLGSEWPSSPGCSDSPLLSLCKPKR